ncbi:MAG: hypothetical protein ABSD96_17740 [Candidatus Korobacteraceae bacterium]|jgi:hypothetical protein
MKLQIAVTKALVLAVGFVLCGAPELLHAWQQPQSEPAPVINGTTVNPSQGPLTPVPAPPETQPAPAQQNQSAPTPSTQLSQRPSQPSVTTEPLGTATAESVPANGGGASRPAGTAIAGEKQHQMRSLVLKLGAVAAAGIAIGIVAGLSKGTPSTAPGSTRAAAR